MRRLTYIFLVLMIVFVACDQTKNMVGPVMTGDAPTPDTETPAVTVEEMIQSVTFDNVLDLEVGKTYKLIPIHVFQDPEVFVEERIKTLTFGSITDNRFVNSIPVSPLLLKGVSADAPKVWATFTLNPTPYAKTLDNESVIGLRYAEHEELGVVHDEIAIEIKQKIEQDEGTSLSTRGRDPFTYHIVKYEAVAIENLTNPDRKFEYE